MLQALSQDGRFNARSSEEMTVPAALGVCKVAETELNRTMVGNGWALTSPSSNIRTAMLQTKVHQPKPGYGQDHS
jgi:hypothetical protein